MNLLQCDAFFVLRICSVILSNDPVVRRGLEEALSLTLCKWHSWRSWTGILYLAMMWTSSVKCFVDAADDADADSADADTDADDANSSAETIEPEGGR